MLKNCPIIPCSNAFSWFHYTSENCLLLRITAYNIIHYQRLLLWLNSDLPRLIICMCVCVLLWVHVGDIVNMGILGSPYV